jgi:RNA polymerase sigma factor (sigma-70 family)
MEPPNFQELLAAARTGDQAAAEVLMLRIEPHLRAAVRSHLRETRLRRVFDSSDICQSALADFLSGALDGRFDLTTDADLRALLVKIALNKLHDRLRHERRHAGSLPDGWDCPDPHLTPGRRAEQADLIRCIRARLSDAERWLFDQRLSGRTWKELAAETGRRAATLRVQLARAVARVREELAAQETPHAG